MKKNSVRNLRDVLGVAEDECFIFIEAAGDDVLGVLHGQSLTLLEAQVLPQKLLVVSQLNDERNVKRVLKPPARQPEASDWHWRI